MRKGILRIFVRMVLVTGATGLLGSHVVVRLLHEGITVRALFREVTRQAQVERLLTYYYPDNAQELLKNLSWFQGDVLDLVDMELATADVEYVIHCAAMVSFHRKDYKTLFETNRQGTANVVNFSLKNGVKKLIHISSTAAIGNESKDGSSIKRETNVWDSNDEASGYSISKYSAEREVWRGIEEGMNAAIVNPSVMFGPGSWEESSLQIFRTLSEGLKYYTSGGNAFVDVRDVAEACLLLLKSDISGERYLVTGHNMPFKEMFDRVCLEMKVNTPNKLAGPFLTGLAWRLSWLLSKFSGKQPTITRESAASAQRNTLYSSEKLMSSFPDFSFTPFQETIVNTIKGRMK